MQRIRSGTTLSVLIPPTPRLASPTNTSPDYASR